MAKRFTDTTKWQDDWFLNLDAEGKLFWFYLCDNCDHAGVWRVSKKAAELMLGFELDLDQYLQAAGDRLKKLDGDYWYLTKFCTFQYGVLNTANAAHRSALKILESRGLEAPFTLPKGSPQGDKDKDKVKVKVESNERWERFWNVCTNKQGKIPAKEAWDKLTADEQETAIRMWGPYASNCAKRQISLKHPQGWLNDKRFNDQFESGPRKPTKLITSMDDL